MKLFKKVSAMVVSLLMALAMMVPVAAVGTGSITVNNTGTESNYQYLQVIKANPKKSTGWEIIAGKDIFTKELTKDDDEKEIGEQEAITRFIAAANDSSKIKKIVAQLSELGGFNNFGESTNKVDGLSEGFYVVRVVDKDATYTYSPMAASIGFSNKNRTVNLNAKKQKNQVVKTTTDKDHAVQNGDNVSYTVTVKVPFISPTKQANKVYNVIDTLKGAEYVTGSVKIVYGDNVAVDSSKASFADGEDGSKVMTVDLKDLIDENNSNAGKTVTITYNAIVTTENDEVTNTATADHGSDSEYDGTTIDLFAGKIVVTKVDNEDESKKLANAKFTLSKGNDVLTFKKVTKEDRTVEYVYTPGEGSSELVSDANGEIIIKGLGKGTYSLKETEAPEGYSLIEEAKDIILGDNISDSDPATDEFAVGYKFANTKVGSLPETGGIGTTIFTVGGCAIMVAAAALFFMNKKKQEK